MAANSSPPGKKTFPDTVIEGAGRAESFFSASIYRVPGRLRKLKESAYTPLLVSIGPFHKDLKSLSPQSRDLKMWYVDSFVGRMADRLKDPRPIRDRKVDVLKNWEEEMTKELVRAKKHYAEEVGGKLTAEMLVVDGCFILEILWRYNKQPMVRTDPIFHSPLIFNTVQIDLLLLENQIPFFVLEKLFNLTLGPMTYSRPSVLIPDYIIPYFRQVMLPGLNKSKDTRRAKICCCLPKDCVVSFVFGNRGDEPKATEETDGKKKEPKATEEAMNDHILQILHDHELPPPQIRTVEDEELVSSASELEYSGIKFLASSRQDLSEIDFKEQEGLFSWFRRAKFTIPRLSMDDSTEPVLRNLIAFEQCHPNTSPYFTSFACLMDTLVSSEKDVEVLQKANVIQEKLGSKKDVCRLLNNITKEIVEDFFFANTCSSAQAYSDREWSKFKAQLRRTWFASPWTFIAFCVAGLVFSISITQFIRSFLKNKYG